MLQEEAEHYCTLGFIRFSNFSDKLSYIVIFLFRMDG